MTKRVPTILVQVLPAHQEGLHQGCTEAAAQRVRTSDMRGAMRVDGQRRLPAVGFRPRRVLVGHITELELADWSWSGPEVSAESAERT